MRVRLATSRIDARGSGVDVEIPVVLRLPMTADVPAPGTHVLVRGRLGAAPPGTDALVALAVRDGASIVELAPPGPLDRGAQAMRAGLRQALAQAPAEAAALVAGLALGDESGQPAALADAMRASGLSHLTAVSGGNLAIVLAVVVGAAGAVRASLRVRTLACLVATAGFTVLVGPQPSVLRAVAMGAIATAGVLLGGRRGGPSILAAGVLVLVVVAPWLATSWGFALSALATAGIVLLGPRIEERLAAARATRRWPTPVRAAVALTVAAQLGALPVLVAMGGAVGWVGVPANLLAAPLVAPTTVLGLAAATVAPVLPGPATALATVATWPAAAIAAIAHAGANAPLAGLPLPAGWWGVAVLAVGGLLAVAPAPRGARRAGGLVAVVAVVTLVVLPPSRHGWPPADWLVIACDVGQGDALVLNAGDGAGVVVDAGPDADAVDRCLTDAGIASVPVLVLTHFHADHVDGLPGVLRARRVDRVLTDPVAEPADRAHAVAGQLAAVGLTAEPVRVGDRWTVGPVSWRTLWPRRVIHTGSVPNNASVVLIADVADRSVLLTGDLEAPAQAAVVPDLAGRRYDVVKVPHHGSANVAVGFATAVPASVALVSVGAGNDYGHPAASTLAAWTGVGALVVRTDQAGDVAVVGTATGVGVVTRR